MDRKGLYRYNPVVINILGMTGCRKAMEVEAPQYDRQLPPDSMPCGRSRTHDDSGYFPGLL